MSAPEPTTAEVVLWGATIGAVSLAPGDRAARFQYDRSFAVASAGAVQPAPLTMPVAPDVVHAFPALNPQTFKGLPGLLADALPDRYGDALIDAWLATQNRTPQSFDAVERLCYVGTRGMGALEFRPARGPSRQRSSPIHVQELVRLASAILSRREGLHATLDADDAEGLREIVAVGTSAGGARAKAVVAWNPATNEVRSGQAAAPEGFEHWLMKFDGVSGNRDRELDDPQGFGRVEYAYFLMARDAGIEIEDCRLFQEGGRSHFMTRRFDRTDDGGKRHVQSLCALCHYDFNDPLAHSYEQAFAAMRRLRLPMAQLEQQFRRMVFNVVARNQDDHVKNIAFLMDRAGVWSLAPAFDVTWSYNPAGDWTSRHQMSINGRRDGFVLDDLRAVERQVGLRRGRAEQLVAEVTDVVADWDAYAGRAGVDERLHHAVASSLRLELRG